MNNAFAKRHPRNALSMGYMGPTGYNDATRANFTPSAEGLRRAAEAAASSQIPGIADVASGVLAVDAARKGNYGEATLNALGLLPFVPSMGGIFVGKGAKTWDAVRADEAQKLLDAGTDPKAVWQQTGTFKGADGALRQEIDDSGATFNEAKLRGAFEDAPPMQMPQFSGVLQHGAAFDAYPDAGDIRTFRQVKQGGGYSPSPYPGGERLSVNLEAYDSVTGLPVEQKSIALHELQHAIQQREGWALGGNPADMPLIFQDLAAQKRREARSLYEQAMRNDPLAPGEVVTPGARKRSLAAERQAQDYEAELARINQFAGLDHESYRRLAGEAEARAVQKRMNYSADQRRAVYPFDDYDVPVNSLIVRTAR